MSIPWNPVLPFGWPDLEDQAAERYKVGAADPLVRADEVRCCVRGCSQWLPPRHRGVPAKYCPNHGISISKSPTYVYRDHHSNFVVAADLIDKVKKVERWRLGNECSEDALSWNVFVSLDQLGLLRDALPDLRLEGDIELYLWGNRIGAGEPTVWEKLVQARKSLELRAGIPTEPDIIVRVPGRALMLIEAKFGSANSTFLGKEERFGSVDEFLDRYSPPPTFADPLNREWIGRQTSDQVLEQLCRNVIFATRLADKGERLFVANLVRGSEETDIETRFGCHLAADSPVTFRRLTWESFHAVFASHGREAEPIANYLAHKSLRFQKAFELRFSSSVAGMIRNPGRKGREPVRL